MKDDSKKVDVLRNWPTARTLADARSFKLLFQFFWRFIKDFSKIAMPLNNLTKKGQGIHK